MSIALPANTRLIPDVTSALDLKCFIGQDRVNAFGLDHPLGPGFRALRKFLIKASLLTAEWPPLVDLNLNAQIILGGLRGSVRDHELRSDLCNSDRCRALLFEAHVAEFVLRNSVDDVGWRRYTPGRSDFWTRGPAIQVECKLVTKRASVQRVMKKAFARVDQRIEGDGPFVLIAGCDEFIDADDIRRLPELIGSVAEGWFARHLEVAAVLAVLPEVNEAPRPSESLARHTNLQFRNGSVAIFRSNVSTAPLPSGFDFMTRGN